MEVTASGTIDLELSNINVGDNFIAANSMVVIGKIINGYGIYANANKVTLAASSQVLSDGVVRVAGPGTEVELQRFLQVHLMVVLEDLVFLAVVLLRHMDLYLPTTTWKCRN